MPFAKKSKQNGLAFFSPSFCIKETKKRKLVPLTMFHRTIYTEAVTDEGFIRGCTFFFFGVILASSARLSPDRSPYPPSVPPPSSPPLIRPPRKAIGADERAYERTVRDRQGFAQQEKSEQEAYLRERERQKAMHQMFGKKVCVCVLVARLRLCCRCLHNSSSSSSRNARRFIIAHVLGARSACQQCAK